MTNETKIVIKNIFNKDLIKCIIESLVDLDNVNLLIFDLTFRYVRKLAIRHFHQCVFHQ